MTGRLIAIVGPSGVGKDSVIAALCRRRDDLHPVRRVITRAADKGGEPFEPVSATEFQRRKMAGEFVLDWQAHGLSYGIPETVRTFVDGGGEAVANLSRGVLPLALAAFRSVTVVALTARSETLAHRLGARGREDEGDVAQRLKRSTLSLPKGIEATEISNEGPLEDTVSALLSALYPLNAARCSR